MTRGIAAAIGPGDTPEQHQVDTLQAGAGLCDEQAVHVLVTEGPAAFDALVERGAHFDRDPSGGIALTREGGHAVRRIAHAADATGRAIHEALLKRAQAHPNITLRERWMAVDLITTRHLKRELGDAPPRLLPPLPKHRRPLTGLRVLDLPEAIRR